MTAGDEALADCAGSITRCRTTTRGGRRSASGGERRSEPTSRRVGSPTLGAFLAYAALAAPLDDGSGRAGSARRFQRSTGEGQRLAARLPDRLRGRAVAGFS